MAGQSVVDVILTLCEKVITGCVLESVYVCVSIICDDPYMVSVVVWIGFVSMCYIILLLYFDTYNIYVQICKANQLICVCLCFNCIYIYMFVCVCLDERHDMHDELKIPMYKKFM